MESVRKSVANGDVAEIRAAIAAGQAVGLDAELKFARKALQDEEAKIAARERFAENMQSALSCGDLAALRAAIADASAAGLDPELEVARATLQVEEARAELRQR